MDINTHGGDGTVSAVSAAGAVAGESSTRAQGGEGAAGGVAGGAAGAMDSGDWRTQLMPDSRQRIVNKITETLKRHLPVSGQEGVQELKKIAVRFEEQIYSVATSQQDYLRKISLKMLTMETKSQNPMTNSIQPIPASSGQNALGTGSHRTDPVQTNLGSLQQNSSVLQQMLQTQQLRLQYHQLQMQQQLFQRQQLMQLQQAVQQQMGTKTGVFQQQQSVSQRVGSHHSQLKSGISSPQFHQALSPQGTEKGKVEGDVTLQMEFEPYNSTLKDSSAQTGNANGADWQEGIYQKIKSMREMYVLELNDLYQKIASGMQQGQKKYTLQAPLMGSGPQDMASDGLHYVGKALVVLVLLLLALIGWVLVLKD